MNLRIQQQGQGLPLVLFHGWGFDSTIWQPLLPSLASKYEVFTVDLPGFGQSDYCEWLLFKTALLARLPKRFALAGWSMGGLFATRLALEEPSRVTHLMSIASSPKFIKDEQWPGVEAQVMTAFYNNLLSEPRRVLRQFIRLQTPHCRIKTANQYEFNVEGLQQGLQTLVNWDLRQQLSLLTQPVCYLFGRLDAITPSATMHVMQNIHPEFRFLLFEKSAHTPFLSEKERFLNELEAFIS